MGQGDFVAWLQTAVLAQFPGGTQVAQGSCATAPATGGFAKENEMPELSLQQDLDEAESEMAAPRIAIAEDDDEMRCYLAAVLRQRGYDVLEARDGAELMALVTPDLARARSGRSIELVITDLRMKGATGMTALRAIRRVEQSLPLILITAYPDGDTIREATNLGATAVLAKPFTTRRLIELVEQTAPRNPGMPGTKDTRSQRQNGGAR